MAFVSGTFISSKRAFGKLGFTLSALLLAAGLGAGARAGDLVVNFTDGDGHPLAGAVVDLLGGPVTEEAPRIIDQIKETFVPDTVLTQPGGTVVFRNSDKTRHHVYSFSDTGRFDFVLRPGDSSPPQRFGNAGIAVIGCNIHDHMIAWVYVANGSWAALSGPDGKAVISGLPAGHYTAHYWQGRLPAGVTPTPVAVDIGATGAQTLSASLAVMPPPMADMSHY